MRVLLFQMLMALALFSCNTKNKNGGTTAVFADYRIAAEEGSEQVTCVFKFYQNRRQGITLFLEPPAAVLLDGTAISGDSAGLSGAYYEVQKPLKDFAGRHSIVFKDAEGNPHEETFQFQPFSLAQELGETVPRGNLNLQLTGLGNSARLRVLLTDTSFTTDDINEIDTVQNGTLHLTRAALENVASGPVTLYLFQEEEKSLQHPPSKGGLLSITYSLSREFTLVDE